MLCQQTGGNRKSRALCPFKKYCFYHWYSLFSSHLLTPKHVQVKYLKKPTFHPESIYSQLSIIYENLTDKAISEFHSGEFWFFNDFTHPSRPSLNTNRAAYPTRTLGTSQVETVKTGKKSEEDKRKIHLKRLLINLTSKVSTGSTRGTITVWHRWGRVGCSPALLWLALSHEHS